MLNERASQNSLNLSTKHSKSSPYTRDPLSGKRHLYRSGYVELLGVIGHIGCGDDLLCLIESFACIWLRSFTRGWSSLALGGQPLP